MTANQSANQWLGRFSSHLLRLRPDLELHVVVQRGVVVYTRMDELDPEEAADLTAVMLPDRADHRRARETRSAG